MEASGRHLWLVLSVLFLHEGACDVDECQIKINGQLQRAAARQMEETLEIKAMLVYVLQNQPTKEELVKILLEAAFALEKAQLKISSIFNKLVPECQQWLQTQNLNKSNFFSAEEKYFYFNKTDFVTWNGARDLCAKRGMQLAMLKTQIQLDAVSKELIRRNADEDNYWLDASDVGQTVGHFRWADGTMVDGSTWRDGKISKFHDDWNKKTCVSLYIYTSPG